MSESEFIKFSKSHLADQKITKSVYIDHNLVIGFTDGEVFCESDAHPTFDVDESATQIRNLVQKKRDNLAEEGFIEDI